MRCHANAKGHPEPARTPDGKLNRTPQGFIEASFDGPAQTTEVGIPDPTAFKKNNKPFFVQTDFLWISFGRYPSALKRNKLLHQIAPISEAPFK